MEVDRRGGYPILAQRVRGAMAQHQPPWDFPTLHALIGERIKAPTLRSMIDGKRPGDPAHWDLIWRTLRLPQNELYAGLGLTVMETTFTGTTGQIVAAVQAMPEDMREYCLETVQIVPGLFGAAQRAMFAEQTNPLARMSHDDKSQTPVDASETPTDNGLSRAQRGERLERDSSQRVG